MNPGKTRSKRGVRDLPRPRTEPGRRPTGAAGATVLTLLVLGLALALVGCGSTDDVQDGGTTTSARDTDTTATPADTTTAPDNASTTVPGDDMTEFRIYFALGEKVQPVHRSVPKTEAVAAAAVEELLKGPTPDEAEIGLTTSVPMGTQFLGVNIANQVATVDLSKEYESGGGTMSMAMRLAQVVYTLTQFPTVEAVQFELDGAPVEVFSGEGIILDDPLGRADFEELTPAVLVESPCIGDTVSSPMRIWGTANTFEAAFMINVVDWDGKVIEEQNATATSGSGTRGTFDVTVPFEWELYPRGALIVFEQSAEDGRPVHTVEIPLDFE